jgi:23S rRNA (uracil1939-C5)-methyltransferase
VGAVEKIASLGAKRIVYISCDPATLARDLAEFETFGYKATRASAVDMFPRTGHCEAVTLLERTKQ